METGVSAVAGVILAGGRSSRMGGGDKGLRLLGGQAMLAHILARVRPQVGPLVLNANGDPARFAVFGLPVVADPVADFPGPLAGVLAGLLWAREHHPEIEWLASFPTDVPFLPMNLVGHLSRARVAAGADLVCAESGGRSHPVFALWPVSLADALRRDLVEGRARKVEAWMARYRLTKAHFPAEPYDPFLNVNGPEDLAEVERLLASGAD